MQLLLAYDGLDYSRFALDEAARIAEEEGADLTVLSVIQPDAGPSKSGGHPGLRPHAEDDIAWAKAFLAQRGLLPDTKIAHGTPADEIVKEAVEGGYDLIVIGTRELGPISQVLLGSVSRKVVKHAPCPVAVAGAHGVKRFEPALV
jgi:nucleotide-binding universal stress UspA family protein